MNAAIISTKALRRLPKTTITHTHENINEIASEGQNIENQGLLPTYISATLRGFRGDVALRLALLRRFAGGQEMRYYCDVVNIDTFSTVSR